MNDKITLALATELKEMRQNASLSQQDVADRIGTTRSRITNYELARRDVPLDIFFKICDVCATDPYEVLDRVRKFVYKK